MKRQYSDNLEERTKAKLYGRFAANGGSDSSRLRLPVANTLSGFSVPAEWDSLTQEGADDMMVALAAAQERMRVSLQGQLDFAVHPAASASAAAAALATAPITSASTAGLADVKARLAAAEHAAAAAPADLADLAAVPAAPAVAQPSATAAAPEPLAEGGFTAAQRAAPCRLWVDATAPLVAPLTYGQAQRACEDPLHRLNIKKLKPRHTFQHGTTGAPLTGTQHTYLTLELPSGEAVLNLREGIYFGYAHTSYDEASQARVEAEVVAVGEVGGEQRVQLVLHGTIPGVLRKHKDHIDGDAVRRLRTHMWVMMVSLVLWMFRTEGVLEDNAWGRLRDVRPGQAAFRPSEDEASRQGYDKASSDC